MTTDAREEVARALCRLDCVRSGGPDSRYGSIDERVDNNCRDFLDEAAAAIAAYIKAMGEAGLKILADSTHKDRSWPEDMSHENGAYQCRGII